MRDDQIYKMKDESNKNLSMFYRQLVFIQTRFDAYEKFIGGLGLFEVIKILFNPSLLTKRIDEIHVDLMRQHDKEVKEIMEKEKKEKSKPKLTIVGANGFSKLSVVFVAALLASGCVSIKKYNQMKGDLQKAQLQSDNALFECNKIVKAKDNELRGKTDRLRKFNQIDANGNLKKLNLFRGDVDPEGWDGPDGSESWIK